MAPARAHEEASVLHAVDEAAAAIKEEQFTTEPESSEQPDTSRARVMRLVEHANYQTDVVDEMKGMIEQLLAEQQQLKLMLQDLSADQASTTTHILQKLKAITTNSSSSSPSTSRPNTLVAEFPATVVASEAAQNEADACWRIADAVG
jgi:antitoxin component HigA of HigAB toxin-antitoxin module